MSRTLPSRFGGSVRMPRFFSVSSIPRQAPTLQSPFAFVQPKSPQMVFGGSLRLSLGNSPTVS